LCLSFHSQPATNDAPTTPLLAPLFVVDENDDAKRHRGAPDDAQLPVAAAPAIPAVATAAANGVLMTLIGEETVTSGDKGASSETIEASDDDSQETVTASDGDDDAEVRSVCWHIPSSDLLSRLRCPSVAPRL